MRVINSRVICPVKFRYNGLLTRFGNLLEGVDGILRSINEKNFTESEMISDIEGLKDELRRNVARITDFFYSFRVTHSNRSKRGAVDIVGTVAHSLFGLATDEQIRQVDIAINNLNTQSDEILKNLDIITSVVELTTDKLKYLRQSQIKSINSISKLYSQVQLASKDINNLGQQALLEHAFSKVGITLLENFMRADELLTGIKNMFAGVFDENIINNKFLLHILSSIKLSGHRLLLPDDSLHLNTYKSILKISSVYDVYNDCFIFLLSIPTYSALQLPTFELYKLIIFPTPLKEAQGAVIKYMDMPKHIAISKNLFIEMQDLDLCKKVNNNYFCELNTGLNTFDYNTRCSAKLFELKEDYLKYCDYRFSHAAQNRVVKVQNTYFYYFNDSLDIEIVCQNASENKHVVLKGLGRVDLAPKCEGLGRGWLLPSSIASYSTERVVKTFHVPKKFSLPLLNTTYLPMINVSELVNITKELGGDITLKLLMKQKRLLIQNQHFRRFQSYRADRDVSSLLVIMCTCWILYSIFKKRKENVYEEPREIPTVPPPRAVNYVRNGANISIDIPEPTYINMK